MRVKDYKCKCGHDDFFFADKGNQKGIYCSYCGKWLKWADKDEQNLTLKQEPTVINEIPKDYKYDTETKDFLVYRHKYTGDEIHIEKSIPLYRLEQEPILDKIRDEIREFSVIDESGTYRISTYLVDQIIDKYMGD